MKKKLLALGMILTLLTGTVTVTAAQIPVVRLNDAEEFEYYSDENGTKIDSFSLNEFTGMAPGDERTQTICLENDSEDTVNFYISQKTLDTLEMIIRHPVVLTNLTCRSEITWKMQNLFWIPKLVAMMPTVTEAATDLQISMN